MPDDAETLGLLALMLLHDARRAARTDADGAYVALDRQDRTAWDAAEIAEGTSALDRALRLRRPGPYQLQAAISALHATAPSADATDWPQIAALYGRLAALAPSPVVEVNRAVAVAYADGPRRGWRSWPRCSRTSASPATSRCTPPTRSCCGARGAPRRRSPRTTARSR